jgi:hypothetical protein
MSGNAQKMPWHISMPWDCNMYTMCSVGLWDSAVCLGFGGGVFPATTRGGSPGRFYICGGGGVSFLVGGFFLTDNFVKVFLLLDMTIRGVLGRPDQSTKVGRDL